MIQLPKKRNRECRPGNKKPALPDSVPGLLSHWQETQPLTVTQDVLYCETSKGVKVRLDLNINAVSAKPNVLFDIIFWH